MDKKNTFSKKNITVSSIVIVLIIIERFLRINIDRYIGIIPITDNGIYQFTSYYNYQLYRFIWYAVIVFLGLIVFRLSLSNDLGFKNDFIRTFLFSFLVTLPMLLGYFLFFKNNNETDILYVFIASLVSAFGEEIYFRGFIFGVLFYKAKWGFIPSAILSGLIFGIGHLYQTNFFYESIGIFFITFLGNAWFSWLFLVSNKNIWLPISVHFFMNLFWDSLIPEANVLGGFLVNMPRIITVFLCSFFIYKRFKHSTFKNVFLRSILFNKSE